MKEGEGSNMAVEGKEFGEKIGGVINKARNKDKAKELLAVEPIETHVDRLGLIRSNRGSRKADRTFVIDKYERG
jgi:hypothetical protein